MMRVGVLASGGGSNFQALVEGVGDVARVVTLVCNVPGAKALDRAKALGVPATVIDHRGKERAALDAEIVQALKAHQVELVCLAGYMRLVTPTLLSAFPGKVINLHPALLPSFPGMHAVRQALAAGVRVTGCTVHFVDEGTDTGPIIAQAAVPVLEGDTEETLGQRVHAEEHRLFPAVVRAIATGRVKLSDRRVKVEGAL